MSALLFTEVRNMNTNGTAQMMEVTNSVIHWPTLAQSRRGVRKGVSVTGMAGRGPVRVLISRCLSSTTPGTG